SRNAGNGQQAARSNGGDDNLNLTPTAPAAARADAPQQVDAATTPRVVQTGCQTSQQQLNLPQIAFELSRQVGDGNTRFQIRLDPAELGRIDVKLDIDKNGQVHARLTVEKAETLDLMQRALEKALQQAGLDQSKTNLEFSLKQNPFAGDQNQRGGDERSGSGNSQDSQEETEVSAPAITLYRGALQASGLNILA
ncbi:MAG: flagellar hook-length control protein FliK, partial [Hyphomicrobiales bacterium]